MKKLVFLIVLITTHCFAQKSSLDSLKTYYIIPAKPLISECSTEQKVDSEEKVPGLVAKEVTFPIGNINVDDTYSFITELHKVKFLPINNQYQWIVFKFIKQGILWKKIVQSSLDINELNYMITSLSIMRDSIFATNPSDAVKYQFESKDGTIEVQASTDNTDLKNRFVCRIYLNYNIWYQNNYWTIPDIKFDKKILDSFLKSLQDAQKILNSQ